MAKKKTSGTVLPQGQEATNRKKRKLWKAEEFDTLIRVLLEEHNLGRQAENGFKEESYQRVVDALRTQHYSRDVAQVKSACRRVCSLESHMV
jgi:lipase chaperone LimK